MFVLELPFPGLNQRDGFKIDGKQPTTGVETHDVKIFLWSRNMPNTF
jgi:hypothetical protein